MTVSPCGTVGPSERILWRVPGVLGSQRAESGVKIHGRIFSASAARMRHRRDPAFKRCKP